jgi:hypothetical protein
MLKFLITHEVGYQKKKISRLFTFLTSEILYKKEIMQSKISPLEKLYRFLR